MCTLPRSPISLSAGGHRIFDFRIYPQLYCKHGKYNRYAESISPTLQAIRARLDLTQQQLAERLGVSFATVNRWEGAE